MMSAEDRVLLEILCARIAGETDSRKFGELMQELIKLLERARQKVGPSDSRAVPDCRSRKAAQETES